MAPPQPIHQVNGHVLVECAAQPTAAAEWGWKGPDNLQIRQQRMAAVDQRMAQRSQALSQVQGLASASKSMISVPSSARPHMARRLHA